MKKLFLVAVMVIASLHLFAQEPIRRPANTTPAALPPPLDQREVSGVVKDPTGQGAAGATVFLKSDKDSIKVADTLKFKTPKGKIVYGGGGIVPDVFVPIEAEHGNENVAYLMQTGVVGHFVFEELDKNRDAFKGLHFNEFLAKMKNSDVYFKKFRNYILMTGLDLKLDKTKALVNRYITAEFARQLYGELYYYDVILKDDAMIKAVLNPKK